MAKSINGAVGKMGSPNMSPDVRTVQQMLNNVPSSEGGPDSNIIVDGRCGPALIGFIQDFQAEQFDRVVEDGKVHPGGQTITRLNTYDDYPALTASSTLWCPHGGKVSARPARTVIGLDASEAPLTLTDVFHIAGCPLDTPCVKVKWVTSPCKILDAQSVGQCVTKANVPQGLVVIENV